MKVRNYLKFVLPSIFLMTMLLSAGTALASTISGTIYDSHHNGLANVDVELLNQYRSLIQHATTDGIGRYSFENLSDGEFYVRVLPFRYDFEEETRSVTIYTISQTANRPGFTIEIVDFVLNPRKGSLAAAQAEVVFAQEISPTAKKFYDDAVKLLKKGKADEAIPQLEEAIKAFPDYFMANDTLGSVYFGRDDFEHAAPLLMTAARVNEKSPITLYQLGYSLSHLHYYKAAIIALKQAAILAPGSPAVFIALGVAQRFQREYKDAEASLLQAKKISRNPTGELFRELAALYGEVHQYDKGASSLEEMLKVGNYTEENQAKIKEQIKAWKELAAKQESRPKQ